MAKKSSRPAIPVELTEEQSAKYLSRYIKPGQRGPEIKIPIWRVLNYVLVVLHTGCQWHKLPIKQDDSGKPEISYIQIFKHFHRWVKLGFIKDILIASVEMLHDNHMLDTSVLESIIYIDSIKPQSKLQKHLSNLFPKFCLL